MRLAWILLAPLAMAQSCPEGLAAAYASMDRSAEKVAHFERQTTEKGDCFQAWYLLAKSQEELDRYADAAVAYRQAARVPATDQQVAFAQAFAEVADEKAALLGQAAKGSITPRAMIVQRLNRDYPVGDPRSLIARRATLLINFELNSDRIERDSVAQARELYEALVSSEMQGRRFELAGHTDSQGAEDYNAELSRRRARSVARYLIERGMAPARLEVVGKGEAELLFHMETEEAHRANRRVEVIALQ